MLLTDSKNLGFTKKGKDAVQFPLNFDFLELPESDLDMKLFDQNLYTLCVPKSEQKELNFVVGIEKAIARILFHFTGKFSANYGGWGFDESGNFYADYYGGSVEEFNATFLSSSMNFTKSRRQIFKIGTDKRISAFCLSETGEKTQLNLKTSSYNGSHTSSGVIYALTTYIIASIESGKITPSMPEYNTASVLYKHFQNCVEAIKNEEKLDLAIADRHLDADIYALLAKENNVKAKFGISCLNNRLYDIDKFEMLNENEFDVVDQVGNSDLLGNKKSIKKVGGFTKSKKKFVKDYLGQYVLNPGRVLTDNEEKMIPHLDDYIINDEILTKAKLICNSSFFPKPMRNVLWLGEAGSGKSSASAILSQLLHIPYTFYTFNPDTMLSDLYVNVLPNDNIISKDKFTMLSKELIDCTSINYDPQGQYEKITGIKKENATEGDCVAAILEKQYQLLNQTSEFKYVESPLVQAFRNGWIVELQEANVCSKPGVLSGINAALDDLATIQLPTGEIVKRHPDTIVIMTANVGYEGTRDLNQAVKSRCSLVGTFNLPDDDDLVEIIKLKAEYDDEAIIKQQIKVLHGIRKKLEETGASDGVCGLRELTDWTIATKILDDPYLAAFNTIIPKATSDIDVQPELVTCLETQFTKKEEFDF